MDGNDITRCTKCAQKLRLPKAKWTATLRCPVCKNEFRILTRTPHAIWKWISDAWLDPDPKKVLAAVGLFGFFVLFFYGVPKPNRPSNPGYSYRTNGSSKNEVFERNINKPSDAELVEEYRKINTQHFSNQLPLVPLHWEDSLTDASPNAAKGYRMQGLWTSDGQRAQIYMNPALKRNRTERTRTLCHEMVHEYLFTVGDSKTGHGPKFRAVLQRLLDEGAVEGTLVSESAKEVERLVLEQEKLGLEHIEAEIAAAREPMGTLDTEFEELNDRIRTANMNGYGWPSEEEIELVRSPHHEQVRLYNGLIREYNSGSTEFNRHIKRYNLMMSYPDGNEEDLVFDSKTTQDSWNKLIMPQKKNGGIGTK